MPTIKDQEPRIKNQLRVLITGGPTREPIDAVRFISNRSSGRTAVALGLAALEEGHTVTLLLGPCCAAVPDGVHLDRFETTRELEALLEIHFQGCDLLIMACAVADYRPVHTSAGKLPRLADKPLALELEATADLTAAMAQRRTPAQRIVAFALEEPNKIQARAREKLTRKNADAIVANPLDTIESQMIEPLWLTAAGGHAAPGPMTKDDFARWLLQRALELW